MEDRVQQIMDFLLQQDGIGQASLVESILYSPAIHSMGIRELILEEEKARLEEEFESLDEDKVLDLYLDYFPGVSPEEILADRREYEFDADDFPSRFE